MPSVGASALTDNYSLTNNTTTFFSRRIVAGLNTYWDTDASGSPRINSTSSAGGGQGWIVSIQISWDLNVAPPIWLGNQAFPVFFADGSVSTRFGINGTSYLGNVTDLNWDPAPSLRDAQKFGSIYAAWHNTQTNALTMVAVVENAYNVSLQTAGLANGINPTQSDAVVQALFAITNSGSQTAGANAIGFSDITLFAYQRARGGQVSNPTWQAVMTSGNAINASAAGLTPLILRDNQATPNQLVLQTPASITANYTLTLPVAQATVAGQTLSNDGTGILSWGSSGGSPGGATTQIQFNNAGAFGGSAALTWLGTGGLQLGTVATGAPLVVGNAITPTAVTPGTAGQVLTSAGVGRSPYWVAPSIGGLGWLVPYQIFWDVNLFPPIWLGNNAFPVFLQKGTVVARTGINGVAFLGNPTGTWSLNPSLADAQQFGDIYARWHNTFSDALVATAAAINFNGNVYIQTSPLAVGVNPSQTDAAIQALFNIVNLIPNGSGANEISYTSVYFYQRARGASTSAGGTPGGLTTQFQYNNAGAFAGAAGLTFDSVNSRASALAPVVASNVARLADVQAASAGLVPRNTVGVALHIAEVNITGTYTNNSGSVAPFATFTGTTQLTIAGVAPAVNSEVLLVAQSVSLQNGSYLVTANTASAFTLTRTSVVPAFGNFWVATNPTSTNYGVQYENVTSNIVVGTSGIFYALFGVPNGAVPNLQVVTTAGNQTTLGAQFGGNLQVGWTAANTTNTVLLTGSGAGLPPTISTSGVDTAISLRIITAGGAPILLEDETRVVGASATDYLSLTNGAIARSAAGNLTINAGTDKANQIILGNAASTTVNRIAITGTATTDAPIISAIGGINLGLNLRSAGTSPVTISNDTNSFDMYPVSSARIYNVFDFGANEIRFDTQSAGGFSIGNLNLDGTAITSLANLRVTPTQIRLRAVGALTTTAIDATLEPQASGNALIGNVLANTGINIVGGQSSTATVQAAGLAAVIDLVLTPKSSGSTLLGNTLSFTGINIVGGQTSIANIQAVGAGTGAIDLVLSPRASLSATGNVYPIGAGPLPPTAALQPRIFVASAAASSTLGAGTAGQVMTSNGTAGAPYWANPGAATILSGFYEGSIPTSATLLGDTLINFVTVTNSLPTGVTYSAGTFTNSTGNRIYVAVTFQLVLSAAVSPSEVDMWVQATQTGGVGNIRYGQRYVNVAGWTATTGATMIVSTSVTFNIPTGGTFQCYAFANTTSTFSTGAFGSQVTRVNVSVLK